MKSFAPVLAAGGTFSGSVLAGLVIGIFADQRTGSQIWVPAGLALGMAAGAYAAIRLLMRSL